MQIIYKTAKELSQLTRIRNAHVKKLRKAGKSEDHIKSYLRGWSTDHYRLIK